MIVAVTNFQMLISHKAVHKVIVLFSIFLLFIRYDVLLSFESKPHGLSGSPLRD